MAKRIGIIIHDKANLFNNGITQNAYFMKLCLEGAGFVCDFVCHAVNPQPFPYGGLSLRSLNNAFPWWEYSALITVTRTLHAEQYALCKKHGVKAIYFICSNNLLLDMEDFVNVYNTCGMKRVGEKTYDEIWVIPSFYYQAAYFRIWENAPVYSVPHLWSPMLLEMHTGDKVWKPKTCEGIILWSLEPNQNAVKTSVVCLAAAEYLTMHYPGLVKHVNLTRRPCNEWALAYLKEFTVPIVHNGFMETHKLLTSMNADSSFPIIVAHQVYNPLNYVYYETMYYGFPFVHNSPMLKDYGYYYEGDDVAGCVAAILLAYKHHNKNWSSMRHLNLEYLRGIDPFDKGVQEVYKQLI